MRSCMMLKASTITEEMPGRPAPPKNSRFMVFSGENRRGKRRLAVASSGAGATASGAARGFAHIGILRTLLANGIVPDVVVGTSIGAVVGGLHAAGRLETFEDWGRSLQGMRNILGYLDIRLNGSGLLGGEKLAGRLEDAVGQTLIEDLPVKFASVATEVRTGHEIWLTRGRLVDAMRASYALPGIFQPMLIGDRWLVDGALVNPVPVSAARALGAEIVIAANLSSDIFTHSTTIHSHGAPPTPVMPEAEEPAAKRRFPRLFSPERTMKLSLIHI